MRATRRSEADRKRAYAETSTTSYRLEPVKCPTCKRMGTWAYGLNGKRAIKHRKGHGSNETKYCEVANA